MKPALGEPAKRWPTVEQSGLGFLSAPRAWTPSPARPQGNKWGSPGWKRKRKESKCERCLLGHRCPLGQRRVVSPASPWGQTQCPSSPADGAGREQAPQPRVSGTRPPVCPAPLQDRAGKGCEAHGPRSGIWHCRGRARLPLGWPQDRSSSWDRLTAPSELRAGTGGGDLRRRLQGGRAGRRRGRAFSQRVSVMRRLSLWWLLSRVCLLLPPPCALVLAGVPGSSSHPQPCQILKRIGHAVRVGAVHLQPWITAPRAASRAPDSSRAGAQQDEPEPGTWRPPASWPGARWLGSALHGRGLPGARKPGEGARAETLWPRDALLFAVDNLNRVEGLLPYNLSLEVVMAIEAGLGDLPLLPFSSPSSPWSSDPFSFLQSVCHTVVVQGVSALLAFPQSQGEMMELDLVSSVLHIPVISIVRHEFPRESQVRGRWRVEWRRAPLGAGTAVGVGGRGGGGQVKSKGSLGFTTWYCLRIGPYP